MSSDRGQVRFCSTIDKREIGRRRHRQRQRTGLGGGLPVALDEVGSGRLGRRSSRPCPRFDFAVRSRLRSRQRNQVGRGGAGYHPVRRRCLRTGKVAGGFGRVVPHQLRREQQGQCGHRRGHRPAHQRTSRAHYRRGDFGVEGGARHAWAHHPQGVTLHAGGGQMQAFPLRAQLGVVLEATSQEAGLGLRQLAIHEGGKLLGQGIGGIIHGRTLSLSIKGRSRVSIASRARKIRERTVPIGQSISSAISS